MESLDSDMDRSGQAGIDFLFVELETARTLLQVAATTQVEESRVRNRDNARLAYVTALQHAPKVALDHEQKQRFDRQVADVRTMLLEAGVTL